MYLAPLLAISIIAALATYIIFASRTTTTQMNPTLLKRDLINLHSDDMADEIIRVPKVKPVIIPKDILPKVPEQNIQPEVPKDIPAEVPKDIQPEVPEMPKEDIPPEVPKAALKDIVIVIPYRDRAVHYEKIMQHLPTIRRKHWNIHTILVEQDDTEPFKRSWLLNIGIAEANKIYSEDACLVTHDVDMIADSQVDYSWCDKPTQICSELSCFKDSVPYKNSAGGVVQASLKDWNTINGFTNTGIGWGGEDDDLHHRFRINGLLTKGTLRRPPKGEGRCHCMNDEHHTKRLRDDKGYSKMISKIKRMRGNSNEWKQDGLNTLQYHITSKTNDRFGSVHYKVKDKALKVTKLQCCSPDHTRCSWTRTGTIPQCEKENLLTLLKFVKQTLNNKLSWYIDHGTYLGSVRNKKHIPHETDIDISIQDMNTAMQLLENAIIGTHFTLNRKTIPKRLFYSSKNKVHVDFWTLKSYGDFMAIQIPVKKQPLSWYKIDKALLYPFATCEYEGDTYPCPRDKKYLKLRYGNDWDIPKAKYSVHPEYTDGAGLRLQKLQVCSNKPSGPRWNSFVSMVTTLNELKANFTLSSGTVLAWYRDCSLGEADIDINIDLFWFTAHIDKLHKHLMNSGWHLHETFGEPGSIGYEEAWMKDGIKTDLFSIAHVDGRYINGLVINSIMYPCDSFIHTFETHIWNSLTFKVPSPIENYLTGKYGYWRQKQIKNYIWDVEPFKTDNNRDHCKKDTQEMKRLQTLFKKKQCEQLIKKCGIQVPSYQIPLIKWTKVEWGQAKAIDKKRWKNFKCIDTLPVYKPIILSENDILPDIVTKSSLNTRQQEQVITLIRTLITQLQQRRIKYFPAFGTLLGSVRNSILMMPWDDDLDFMIGSDSVKKLTFGLRKIQSSAHCAAGQWDCQHYDFGGGIMLTYKTKGIPWKISFQHSAYPYIDILTYDTIGDRAIIPKWQLVNTRTQSFDKDITWIGAVSKKKEVQLSLSNNYTFLIPIPENAEKILTTDYGEDAFITCKTSYQHKPFCHGKNCNKNDFMPEIHFPCSLLQK